MSETINRLSSDVVMNVGMRGYKEYIDYNWHGKMIKIKYLLEREEEIELIHSIIDCCTAEEDDEEYVREYVIPEFVDLATRANIVSVYANVNLPENIDEQHRLLYYNDIYDVVVKHANSAQITNIINMVKHYMK